jgi:tubulin polyglutamylase TTLL5
VGIDTSLLWSRIYDSIVKSLLAGEASIVQALRRLLPNRQNCFELLGFDVMIDSNLKPWVLEVNLTPSLACEASLDFQIKSNLLIDSLNLV